jgi:hypothetical protein
MRRSLVALGALVAGWTMIGIPAHATYGARVTADEPQYLLSAISLGNDGDLDISDELADGAYRSFHSVDIDPQTYPLDGSGRQVSPHDPLLPAVLAAPVRLGGWVAAKATLAILAAALAMLTAWTAVRRFGVRPRIALAIVAVFACTAPLASYATQVYPEIPAALAVMAAVAALSGPLDRRRLAAGVAAVVVLPWLSIKYAPVAAMLALVALWRARDRRPEAAVVGATLTVAAVAYAAAHQAIYGGWTAYATGDHFAQAGQFAVVGSSPNYLGRARRLVGLIVDDSFGIGAWMIGWLALPLAMGVLLRRRPVDWAILALPLAAGWLTATFVASTMHGWWWPGRQLVVVLPIAVIVIAVAANGSTLLVRFLTSSGVVGAATWMWTTIEAITRRHVLVVDFDQTANPWMRVWRVVLPDGRDPTTADNVLSVVWVGAVVLLFSAGRRTAGRPSGLSTRERFSKVLLTTNASVD